MGLRGKTMNTINKRNPPPSPPALPVLGNFLDIARDGLLETVQNLQSKYGDVVKIRFGTRDVYLFAHPDAIEHVLLNNAKNYRKANFAKGRSSFLGRSILNSDGEFWRNNRRMMQPAFHHKRIQGYFETILARAEHLVTSWHDGKTLDITQDMKRITLEIAVKCLFGVDVVEKIERLNRAFEIGTKQFTALSERPIALPEWFPIPENARYRRSIAELDALMYNLIAERRSSGTQTPDLLSMLLETRNEQGIGMNDRQVRDEMVTLFFAGHDTTALTLTYTWHLLATHAEVESRLHSELEQVLQGRNPTLESLRTLPYLSAVIKEVMRIYPTVWGMFRQANHDDVVAGQFVPARATVLVSQWLTQRDPRWFEHPNDFNPERWLETNQHGSLEQRLPKYAYFPFGGGPRICIGNSLALMEMQVLIALIAQRYQLKRDSHQKLELRPGITVQPKHSVNVLLQAR
jgi:cytochrome P450